MYNSRPSYRNSLKGEYKLKVIKSFHFQKKKRAQVDCGQFTEGLTK